MAIHTLEFGNRELLTRKLEREENSRRIAPGQSVEVVFIPRDVDRLASLLRDTGYQSGSPEKLHLSVGHIIFDDDSMWYAGAPHQRDSDAPNTWRNTEALAKRGLSDRDPGINMRLAKSGSTLVRNRLADRLNIATSLPSSSALTVLLSPVAYTSQPAFACYSDDVTTIPGCGSFGWCGAECRYFQDHLTTNPGNYFLAAASALCTRAACINESGQINCNGYRSTTVKNTCYGGGGGGGGGGEGGGGGSCYGDWDCDFGYYCDDFGQCQEDLDD